MAECPVPADKKPEVTRPSILDDKEPMTLEEYHRTHPTRPTTTRPRWATKRGWKHLEERDD